MDDNKLTDHLGRPLRDLRVSVTDRCNFRCSYCMPKEVFGRDYAFLPREQILSFEEIRRLAGIFAELGVRKIRLTGGEPLLRKDVEHLVSSLAEIDGLDLAMTTNGSVLTAKAQALVDAGLKRVTVSLDSVDEETFKAMNDMNFPLERVLEGIEAAQQAGLGVKINTVVRRGVNEGGVIDMARRFHGTGITVRFIEFMDVGNTNGWSMDDVVPAKEIIEMISERVPLEPIEDAYRGEVANRFRYLDGGGEVGVIASVTQPFCRDCTRARLSAEGKLFTCLFASAGHDLKSPLRAGETDDQLRDRIMGIWHRRTDRYSEIRTAETATSPHVEMSYIGG